MDFNHIVFMDYTLLHDYLNENSSNDMPKNI